MTATATLIAVRTRLPQDSPPMRPTTIMSAATTAPATANCLPTRSSRIWSGVGAGSTAWISSAMRPSSVAMPVATTTPTARP